MEHESDAGNPRGLRQILIILVLGAVAAVVVMSVLAEVPVSHTAREPESFPMALPFDGVGTSCTEVTFYRAGSFGFSVFLGPASGYVLNGTVHDAQGTLVYSELTDTTWSGAIPVSPAASPYEFCLDNNGVVYPDGGGTVVVNGTLTYTYPAPIL